MEKPKEKLYNIHELFLEGIPINKAELVEGNEYVAISANYEAANNLYFV